MVKRILVTGATGLVGRHVVDAGRQRGLEMLPASRTARAGFVQWPGQALPDVDAVIHLAGASIGGRRWNKAYKQEILRSRVETTKMLREALPDAQLVCANAVGYYGMDPPGVCTPASPPGDDFLAQVCQAWQEAAGDATIVRIGHVLAKGDGLLGRLEPLHRRRVAGILGTGQQGLPWVLATDLANQLLDLASQESRGVVHGVQGNMTLGELHRELCERIGGFPKLHVPKAAIRMMLGEFAPFILTGQTVQPDPNLPQPTLTQALDQLYA